LAGKPLPTVNFDERRSAVSWLAKNKVRKSMEKCGKVRKSAGKEIESALACNSRDLLNMQINETKPKMLPAGEFSL